MTHLRKKCWASIFTEQIHSYIWIPVFTISTLNAIEQSQGSSLFSHSSSLFIASLSDRSDAQEWALTQHICSQCVAESYILFLLPKIKNIYFSPWQSHRVISAKEKKSKIHSVCHKKIILNARASLSTRNLRMCPEHGNKKIYEKRAKKIDVDLNIVWKYRL